MEHTKKLQLFRILIIIKKQKHENIYVYINKLVLVINMPVQIDRVANVDQK